MKKLLLAILPFLLASVPAAAQDWQHRVNQNGLHSASVSTAGKTPDGEAQTTLTIQCSGGKGGLTTVEFTVVGTAKMKNFPFADFEGPDAPNQAKKTVLVKVNMPRSSVSVRTAVAGWYSAAHEDAFTFGFVADRNLKVNVKRLTDALLRGASTVNVTVQDPKEDPKENPKNPKRIIQAQFPVAGAAAAVSKTLQGCGK